VADLAEVRLPGVFEQIRLVAGVRWRMLKNNMRRKQNVWDLIAMIWVSFVIGISVLGLSVAFFAGGYEFLVRNHLRWLPFLYWGIFLWWQVFPIFVAGFGPAFEFSTLLRFPMSRRAFYLLGLGYGFSDFAALSSICWMFALLAGAATARLSILPVMLLVSFLFILLNVTLERLIGSLLEKLLAKRKSREIFLGLFILSMVSLNFLNPMIQRMSGKSHPQQFFHFFSYLYWSPASLAGTSIRAAALADTHALLTAIGGLLVWALVFSLFLWHRYAALYSGEEISDSPAATILRKKEKKEAVPDQFPGLLAPQVAAIVAKEFRYLVRNGFAFISLIIPPAMVVFFTLQFGPGSILKEHSLKPTIFFPAIMGYLLLILLSPAYNSFAFEGKGIQTYFLAPMRFRDILLGKNLFLMAMVVVELSLAYTVLTYRVGWPGTPIFVATIAGGAFALIGQLTIANWSSLSFPKKMEIGKMKGQRNSGVAVWLAFGAQIVVGGICALILLAGAWMQNPWLPPIAFLFLFAAALGGYISSLRVMDRLAESKKELLIETLTK
jgi:ABC-2 type transport system permease protein